MIPQLNEILERELSGYRIISNAITRITDEHEIKEIDRAISDNNKTVSEHIQQALRLYSKRENPDYRNAIKEAISAVESSAKRYAGDQNGDLEKVLKKLENQMNLHSQIVTAFKNLYRWTSSSDGIRHAMMDEPSISEAEARFMIIACSAFCNLLFSAQSKE